MLVWLPATGFSSAKKLLNIVIPSELLPFQIFVILNSSSTFPYLKGEKIGQQSWPYLRVSNNFPPSTKQGVASAHAQPSIAWLVGCIASSATRYWVFFCQKTCSNTASSSPSCFLAEENPVAGSRTSNAAYKPRNARLGMS